MDACWCGGAEMNIIELAKQVGMVYREFEDEFANSNTDGVDLTTLQKFAALVAAQEREAIMKSIEELRPVEDNPLLQTKPAVFWIENFRQIVYARGEV